MQPTTEPGAPPQTRTEAQREASRRNGAKSRGPVTPHGKRIAARNSTRHGILAETIVLDGENRAYFDEIWNDLIEEHNPRTETELHLVATMAAAEWRLFRLQAIENRNLVLEMTLGPNVTRDDLTLSYPSKLTLAFRNLAGPQRTIDLLERYQNNLLRQQTRALNTLAKLRKLGPPAQPMSSQESNEPGDPSENTTPPPSETQANPDAAPPSHSQASMPDPGSVPSAETPATIPAQDPLGYNRDAMPYQDILSNTADRVATITLNRPDKLNAWTATMEREVHQAMLDAEADPDARVIVLTGAGRGFCAGADMSLLSDLASTGINHHDPEQALRNSNTPAHRSNVPADFQRKYSYFPALQKPVIAAINGPAVGLGLILSLYCDLRFAADTAKFGTAFARRGLIAEFGIAWLLPKLIGPAHALDLLLSARVIDAAEAHRIGLVNRVFPATEFDADVAAYARELAYGVSPRSMRVIKSQVYAAMFQTLGEAFDASEGEMLLSLQSDDFKEGVAHFLEKRAPVFTGK